MTMLAQPSKYCGPSLYAIAGLSLLISHLPSLDLLDDGELKSQGVIALGTLNVLVHRAMVISGVWKQAEGVAYPVG